MKKLQAVRTAAATALVAGARVAQAAGDSGTSSVGDMNVSGAQLGMIIGGVAVMGVVIWLLIKFVSK
jgi:hypothetical protein